MAGLSDKECIPCKGGVPPLPKAEAEALLAQVEGWRILEDHRIERVFTFEDFAKALTFTNSVGAVAEAQGHHPEIHLGWGRVAIEIWTHKINGLTESDFILAAKIDTIER